MARKTIYILIKDLGFVEVDRDWIYNDRTPEYNNSMLNLFETLLKIQPSLKILSICYNKFKEKNNIKEI